MKPVSEYQLQEMYEPGRYVDANICRVCGVEVADVFRERHAAFHESLVLKERDTDDES